MVALFRGGEKRVKEISHTKYKIGDLVTRARFDHQGEPRGTLIGVVVEILEPQIYDRSERICVQWTGGYKSYEKEYNLRNRSLET